jgi:hypothetical protein
MVYKLNAVFNFKKGEHSDSNYVISKENDIIDLDFDRIMPPADIVGKQRRS